MFTLATAPKSQLPCMIMQHLNERNLQDKQITSRSSSTLWILMSGLASNQKYSLWLTDELFARSFLRNQRWLDNASAFALASLTALCLYHSSFSAYDNRSYSGAPIARAIKDRPRPKSSWNGQLVASKLWIVFPLINILRTSWLELLRSFDFSRWLYIWH